MKQKVEIVLVEDKCYEAALTIRALKLKLPDYEYIHLTDGEEALDFLFARGNFSFRRNMPMPALILLDLALPKIHGADVLREIKSSEATRRIPVVVLTVSQHKPSLDLCYDLGANSFICKPVDFPKFTEAIADIGQYWLLRNSNPWLRETS